MSEPSTTPTTLFRWFKRKPHRPLNAQEIIVRAGSEGEALVTWPNGRIEFMGLWKFLKFSIWAALHDYKITVQDDKF